PQSYGPRRPGRQRSPGRWTPTRTGCTRPPRGRSPGTPAPRPPGRCPARAPASSCHPLPTTPARRPPLLLEQGTHLLLLFRLAPVGGGLAYPVGERGHLHQRVGRGRADHGGQVGHVG